MNGITLLETWIWLFQLLLDDVYFRASFRVTSFFSRIEHTLHSHRWIREIYHGHSRKVMVRRLLARLILSIRHLLHVWTMSVVSNPIRCPFFRLLSRFHLYPILYLVVIEWFLVHIIEISKRLHLRL